MSEFNREKVEAEVKKDNPQVESVVSLIIKGPLAKALLALYDYEDNKNTVENKPKISTEDFTEAFITVGMDLAYNNIQILAGEGNNDAKAVLETLKETSDAYVELQEKKHPEWKVKGESTRVTPEEKLEIDAACREKLEIAKKEGISREKALDMYGQVLALTDQVHASTCKAGDKECPYTYGTRKLKELLSTLPSDGRFTQAEVDNAFKAHNYK